jgi:two-component system, chemotaxis family, protein-glutamate methylesterase/glutaminase
VTPDRNVPVVALGASAGGVAALSSVVRGLPESLPAAVLVVLHVAPAGPSVLPAILARAGPLPAAHAADGDEVRPGRIYVAPPDHHLEVEDGRLVVSRSPRENGVRPSVDTLFRSVARERRGNAVAAVLSGTLDDGTSGLLAVRQAGGRTVVQDPDDADFPGMPRSALRFGWPEFVAPLEELPGLLCRLVEGLPLPAVVASEEIEVKQEELSGEIDKGAPSQFTCPDCGGTLFEKEIEGLLQFRCRVGHGYTAETLLAAQDPHLESALYAAIVALDERSDLSRRMARRMEQAGRGGSAARYRRQAEETERQASLIREAVANLHGPVEGSA